jgi:hypothetical protein
VLHGHIVILKYPVVTGALGFSLVLFNDVSSTACRLLHSSVWNDNCVLNEEVVVTNLRSYPILIERTEETQSVYSLGYRLDDRVSIPSRGNNEMFSPRHRVLTGSGAHPTSYQMGAGGCCLGVKRPGREAGHSSPCSVEVKNTWSCTATPPIRLHGVVLNTYA